MTVARKSLTIATLTATVLLLAGCSSNVKPTAAVVTDTQVIVDSGLEQAAQQASASLVQLAAIEKARYPHDAALPFADVHSAQLDTFVSVDWYGPIAPLLQEVAQQIGYTVQVYGKPPQTPILVNIDDTQNKTSAINIIRNADLQAGTRANVLVYPKQNLISLRYSAS